MIIYQESACLFCCTKYPYRSNKKFCSRKCKELNKDYPWRKFKKSTCEECGFVPVHKCQLDVDHVDGNKKNNSSDNLRTLCANCHRLKTHLNEDYLSLYHFSKKRGTKIGPP